MLTDKRVLNLKQNELPALKPGPVCYLAGAGLSAASKYKVPTAVAFLSHEFTKHADGEDKHVNLRGEPDPALSQLLDRLEKDYGDLRQQNLETVMTDLYVRAFGIARAWEGSDYVGALGRPIPELRRDYTLLINYIRERLPALCGSSRTECGLVKGLVRQVRPEDSIVTLNYDTVLEPYFYERTGDDRLNFLDKSLTPMVSAGGMVMFGSVRPTPPRGVFTKLHGSKDWFTCPNEACVNRHFIQPMNTWYQTWQGALVHEPFVPYCLQCGSSRRPVIIPPTTAKAFDEFPKLGVMWSQSYEAFRDAARWVFIGVSLAATDFHLSSFLRSLTRGQKGDEVAHGSCQICVVNPDFRAVSERLVGAMGPNAAKAFREKYQPTPMYVFDSIEEYSKAADASDHR